MRRPAYHRDDQGRLEVKMTPMIDVIFLLLIFFVCTASFQVVEEVLPTNLALPGSLDIEAEIDPLEEDLDEITVKIVQRGDRAGWQINGRDYDQLEHVRAVLGAAAEIKIDLPVILDIDAEVPIEYVIDICDVCRQIGLQKVQFAVSSDV
jgi:biopolymer transport protein ExbD